MIGYLEQKLLGRLQNGLVFLNIIFMSVRISKFQCDPFNNKNILHKGPTKLWGLSKMAHFIFEYFSTKLGTSVDGHEKQ
jgi:hypothetical protein